MTRRLLVNLILILSVTNNLFAFQDDNKKTLFILPFADQIKFKNDEFKNKFTLDSLTEFKGRFSKTIEEQVRVLNKFENVGIEEFVNQNTTFEAKLLKQGDKQYTMKIPKSKSVLDFSEKTTDFVLIFQDITLSVTYIDSDSANASFDLKAKICLWDNRSGSIVESMYIELPSQLKSALSPEPWNSLSDKMINQFFRKFNIQSYTNNVKKNEFISERIQTANKWRITMAGQFNFHAYFAGQNVNQNGERPQKDPAILNFFDNSISFSPSAEYFVSENIALGLEYNYENQIGNSGKPALLTINNQRPTKEELTTQSFGGTFGYYATYNENSKFYFKIRVLYRSYSATGNFYAPFNETKYNFDSAVSPGISVGFSSFVGESKYGVTAETGFDYSYTNLKNIETQNGEEPINYKLDDPRIFIKLGIFYDFLIE